MPTKSLISDLYRLDINKDGTGSVTDADGDRIVVGHDRVSNLTLAFEEHTDLFNTLCDLLFGLRAP